MRSLRSRLQSGRALGEISLLVLLGVAGTSGAEAQPLEVSGTLELSDGSPAKGVLVELIPFPVSYLRRLHELRGDALPEAVDRTESADDGSYRLSVPGPGTWRLMIRPQAADGVTAAAVRRDLLPLVESVELPTITLPERRTLAVEVLASGAPVADALVLAGPLQASLRDPAHGRFSPVVNRPAARTGEDGIARFSLPEGPVRVRVVAPGHHLGGEDSSSRRVRIDLRPGPSRKIVVVDAGDRPMSGAIVRVGDSLIPITTTDEDGRAVVGTVPGQSVSYQAETLDGDYGSSGTDYPPVGETGDDPVIRIVVEPPERVQGRLVDAETGVAVTGALVWSPLRPSDQVLSDRSGSFSLATWTSSRGLSLEVTAPGYAPAQLQPSPAQLRLGEEQILALAPARLLIGRVIDEVGQAIGGALVRAEARDQRAMVTARRGDLIATTGDDGAFRLGGLLAGAGFGLEVSAEGFAPSRLEVAPTTESEQLEIVLQRGLAAFGRVVDAEDRPVAGATITLRPLWERTFDRMSPPLGEAKSTTTDTLGDFRLESLPPGRYDLEASLSGYAPTELAGLVAAATGEELDLGTVRLEHGAVISGVVLDSGRQPLVGATVELHRQTSLVVGRPPAPLLRTSADDGSFAFDSVRTGEQVSLRASHQDLATADVHGARAPSGEPIEIVLEAGATLTGRVVDSRGNPVAGARVQLTNHQTLATAGLRLPQLRYLVATSGEDGAYSIARIPTGTWRAWATGPGGESAQRPGVEVVSGRMHRLDLVVEPRITFSGRVTGPSGEPAPGADVSFERSSGSSQSSSSLGVTDAAGLFHGEVHDRETAGIAEVVVSHPGYREGRRQVAPEPGENVVDVRLERGWEIRGQVVDSDGSPLSGARIGHWPMRPQVHYREPRPVVTDAHGRFTIQGLDDGEYQLSAAREGYAEAALDTPAVIEGASVYGIEIVLGRGGALAGRVIGLPPERRSRVSVMAYRDDVRAPLQQPPEVIVDPEGTFRIGALQPGVWQVRARLMEDGRSVERAVRIEEAGAESFVELEFESGYTLSGWVTREGEPLAGAAISLFGETGDHRQARTDHLGEFVLEALTAGHHYLRIDTETRTSHTRQIELLGDDEILIELSREAVLSGAVVDELGAPLVGAQISAVARVSQSGMISSGGHAESRADGSFEIHLEAGQWELRAALSNYSQATLAIDLAGGERIADLRLTLAPAEALTLVVRRAGGLPVDTVAVARIDQRGGVGAFDSAAVGPDGRAVLRFLPPGTWPLWVYSDDTLPVQITVDVPGDPVAVTLEPAGHVDLTVADLVEEPGTARVKAVDPSGVVYRHPLVQVELVGRVRAGRGSLGPLPPGLWTVVVESDDGGSWSRAVEVVAGQTVSLVIE